MSLRLSGLAARRVAPIECADQRLVVCRVRESKTNTEQLVPTAVTAVELHFSLLVEALDATRHILGELCAVKFSNSVLLYLFSHTGLKCGDNDEDEG